MKVLRLDTSIRKTDSYSRRLSDKLIQLLISEKSVNVKNNKIVIRDLADGIPLIDENWSKANFTLANERSPEENKCLAMSDLLVAELNNADAIVIGLPIYNFNIPATFKAWIDLVVRSKLTFRYTENGPIGLVSNKKVYIIIVSGGTNLGTELDFISAYLHHIFGFIGISDITIIDSSGLGKNESQTLAHAHKLIEQI